MAFGLLFMWLGLQLVSGVIDLSPVIGSPQIDYPGFNFHWGFWPQLTLFWIVVGGGGCAISALAMTMLSDEPVSAASWPRLLVTWLAWFGVAAGLRLAGFLAYGTMGPLHTMQPILRMAVTNGIISAGGITALYASACWVLEQPLRARRRVVEFGVALAAVCGLVVVAVAGVAVAWRLPVGALLGFFAPYAGFIAAVVGLLACLSPRRVRAVES